jgi:hypothetical protein
MRLLEQSFDQSTVIKIDCQKDLELKLNNKNFYRNQS